MLFQTMSSSNKSMQKGIKVEKVQERHQINMMTKLNLLNSIMAFYKQGLQLKYRTKFSKCKKLKKLVITLGFIPQNKYFSTNVG